MPDRHLWTRHSSKTIAFDGTAGLGLETSDVTVFTLTGRVLIHAITAFCSETLEGATATIELGVTGDTDAFITQTTATSVAADEWWAVAAAATASGTTLADSQTGGATTSQRAKAISASIILTIGTADVTNGTLVFDVLYTPLTDGARLA